MKQLKRKFFNFAGFAVLIKKDRIRLHSKNHQSESKIKKTVENLEAEGFINGNYRVMVSAGEDGGVLE